MLLDTIATVILAGMMLVPVVNIFAGVIVGAGLGGALGALAGLLLALIVMAGERALVAWLATEVREPGARQPAVTRATSQAPAGQAHTAVLAKGQPEEFVPPAPLLEDYPLDAPLFVGTIGRVPHGGSPSLSA